MSFIGSVEVAELEIFLKTEICPFNTRVFTMYDDNGSNELEFVEFLLMVWTFCSLDDNHLGNLYFYCLLRLLVYLKLTFHILNSSGVALRYCRCGL